MQKKGHAGHWQEGGHLQAKERPMLDLRLWPRDHKGTNVCSVVFCYSDPRRWTGAHLVAGLHVFPGEHRGAVTMIAGGGGFPNDLREDADS